MCKDFTVYMHISPNNKRYIGITSKSITERWAKGNGYRNNRYFFDAIKKYGEENFKHVVLAEHLSKEDACELEKSLIEKYNTTNRENGYNHSIGGELSAYGVKRSAEYIEQLRKRRTGKIVDQETRKKISDSLKGNIPHNKGVAMNVESKKKMSKPIICIETGAYYYGINEAERQTSISSRNIGACLRGKRSKAGGFHWKYAV